MAALNHAVEQGTPSSTTSLHVTLKAIQRLQRAAPNVEMAVVLSLPRKRR